MTFEDINQELLALAEDMYFLNASISAVYIAQKKQMTPKAITEINLRIGKWIKKVREIAEANSETET